MSGFSLISAQRPAVALSLALTIALWLAAFSRVPVHAQNPASPTPPALEPVSAEALAIHKRALVIDGHNDLPWAMRTKGHSDFSLFDIAQPQPGLHTDIPRLQLGGVGAQFWSAFVPAQTARTRDALRITLEQVDLIHRMTERYPDVFELARSADDILRIRAAGRIACLIGIEGGHSIENSLSHLRTLHRLGAIYMTLTHSDSLDWVDAASDQPRSGGLSEFGRQVVAEMNRLGMLVDISHVSPAAMHAVLDATRAPIIASHSGAYAVAPHVRNIPDDVLKRMAANGGVVMVNFFSGFVVRESARITARMFDIDRELRAQHPNEEDFRKARAAWHKDNPLVPGTVADVVDHIEHIVKTAGIDHAGLGADYDGVSTLPRGLEDVAGYPRITQELLRRGYAEPDIRKILGENLLRVLRECRK